MQKILIVGLGGFFGCILRYLISSCFINIKFPLGTLIVNVLGGLLIGFIMGFGNISEELKMFLTVGLLGGLTTFSTFSMETVNMIYQGRILYAGLNIILNIFLSFLGVVLGKFCALIV